MTRRHRYVDRAGMPDCMLDNRSTAARGRFGALPALFDAVPADAYFPLAQPAARELERANVRQVRAALADIGLAGEIDDHLAGLDSLDLATPPLVSACGRRAA